MKDWKTSLFGFLAAFAPLLHSLGVTFGHVGNVDIPTVVSGVGTVLLGYTAADKAKNGAQ